MLKKIEVKSEEIQKAREQRLSFPRTVGDVGLFSLAKGKLSVETDAKCICLGRNTREGEELFKFS